MGVGGSRRKNKKNSGYTRCSPFSLIDALGLAVVAKPGAVCLLAVSLPWATTIFGTKTYASGFWRPSRSKPVYRGDVDAEGLRNLADQVSFMQQPLGQLRLIRVEFSRPSKPNASLLSRIPPGARTFADQIAFELGDAGEHRHNHFPSVCDVEAQGSDSELAAGFADRFHRVQQISGGAR
jgi:hypothetical protein